MSMAMQQYTAANFALAWQCRVEPTPSPSVWTAWRGGTHPAAVLWVDETALDLDAAEANARAALGHGAGPGVVVVLPVSASRALWTNGSGPRELAMPVAPRRPRRDPLWWCQTCTGRHPLSRMAACRAGETV